MGFFAAYPGRNSWRHSCHNHPLVEDFPHPPLPSTSLHFAPPPSTSLHFEDFPLSSLRSPLSSPLLSPLLSSLLSLSALSALLSSPPSSLCLSALTGCHVVLSRCHALWPRRDFRGAGSACPARAPAGRRSCRRHTVTAWGRGHEGIRARMNFLRGGRSGVGRSVCECVSHRLWQTGTV